MKTLGVLCDNEIVHHNITFIIIVYNICYKSLDLREG